MVSTSENTEQLSRRLRQLNNVSIELTKASSSVELFRLAVELGCAQLGFDRLAIFLVTDKPHFYIPTFGTDEFGNTRDERTTEPISWGSNNSVSRALAERPASYAREEANLRNHQGKVVGTGWHVITMLWDGDNIIGWMTADNLINQNPLTHHDVEILELYGVSIGHLWSRKRIEETLVEERNLLRTIIDNTPDYIYVKDSQSRFTLVNRPYYLKDRTPQTSCEQDIIGKSDFDFYPESVAAQYLEQEQQVIQEGIPILNQEETETTSSGEKIHLLTTKVPLRDHHDNIIGLAGVSRDITELKQMEQDRYDLQLHRERVALMDELVNNLSHDLKTSLSIIGTSLYLVTHLDDPSRQMDKIKIIENQILRLEKIIQDTLFLSSLHYTKDSTITPLDLNQVLRDILTTSQPSILAKDLTIQLDFTSTPFTLYCHESAIIKMLTHLLENAITYSPEQEQIYIHTSTQGHQVWIEISNRGIGLSEENLKRIFEPFYRVDESRSIENGGAGLGLAIVKQVVALHNGTIEVESNENQSTTFRIGLPLK